MDFKVRCLMALLNGITKGKIYEIQNGYFHYDDGNKAGPYKNFKDFEQHFNSRFELVTDKPRICEILGIEDEQDFIFDKKHYIIAAGADKEKRVYLNDEVGDHFAAYVICDMINHPEKIIRQPQFSEDEKALMRLLVSIGTPFIARDEDYNEIKSSSIPQIRRYNPNIWIVERTAKVRDIPKEIFSQITWENSPFDAKTYLEGLK